jgi:hypothetical protein
MQPVTVALIVVVCLLGSMVFGSLLQRVLPEHHISPESKGAMQLGTALLATLTALVLGLLISSAKSTADTLSSGVVQTGAKILTLDRMLAHYGPDADPARAILKHWVGSAIVLTWHEKQSGMPDVDRREAASGMDEVIDALGHLSPHDSYHQAIWSEAMRLSVTIAESRSLLLEEVQTPLPVALLVLLCFWLAVLFVQFGLFAPRNGTVAVMLIICAVSAAGAIFLILELSRPLGGAIRISSGPMRQVYQQLGQ